MQRMVDVSFPLRSRLVHVQYRSLVSDPIGTIAQIHNGFGPEFSQAAREAISAKLAQAPTTATAPIATARGIRNRSGARAPVHIERFDIAS
jgi:hypothetical protein